MSLINQMLKDLEKRRAGSVASPDSPLKGVNRYSVARRQPPVLLYGLTALVLVLLALVGFLGWTYLNPTPSAAAPAPIATAPAVKSQVEAPPLLKPSGDNKGSAKPVKPQPQTRTTNPNPQASDRVMASKSTAEQAPASDSPSPETRQSDNQTRQTEQEIQREAEPPVTKRSRPLSAEQRAELAYKKGYQLLGREQAEAGERALREALEHYRSHHRARELLAGIYIKSGRYVEAAALLKEGVALAPQNSLFAKLYARVLLKQDKMAQAIAVLEHQPPLPGVDSEYHALLAAIYQQAGEHLKAAALYRDILRVNPRQGNWWIGLAISLEQLDKQAEARSAYNRAKESANLSDNLRQYVDKRLAALDGTGS